MSHLHNYIGVGPGGLTGLAKEVEERHFAKGSVKVHVTFPVDKRVDGMPVGEYLWAHPANTPGRPDRFVIDVLPFYEVGFTYESIVRADRVDAAGRMWEFRQVVQKGPWRQVWFGTIDPNGGPTLNALMAVHPEGRDWKFEAQHTSTFVGIARGAEKLKALKDTLHELCEKELIGFYWDDESDGEIADSVAEALPPDLQAEL